MTPLGPQSAILVGCGPPTDRLDLPEDPDLKPLAPSRRTLTRLTLLIGLFGAAWLGRMYVAENGSSAVSAGGEAMGPLTQKEVETSRGGTQLAGPEAGRRKRLHAFSSSEEGALASGSNSRGNGSLRVLVEAERGLLEALAGSRIELLRADSGRWVLVDAQPLNLTSAHRFSNIGSGVYSARIEAPSRDTALLLPSLPMASYAQSTGASSRAGLYPTIEMAGEEGELRIYLHTSSIVRAHVSSEFDVVVQLEPRDVLGKRTFIGALQGQVRGVHECTVYPGEYWCRVTPTDLLGGSESAASLGVAVAPRPISVTALPGQVHEVFFPEPRGLRRVHGRVVSPSGRPQPGISVLIAHYSRSHESGMRPLDLSSVCTWVTTSASGEFSAEGLPVTALAVQVDPYGTVPREPGALPRLSKSAKQVVVGEGNPGSEFDCGSIEISPARIVQINGRLRIHPKADSALGLSGIRALAFREPPLEGSVAEVRNRSQSDISVDAQGRFTITFNDSLGACWLSLTHQELLPFGREVVISTDGQARDLDVGTIWIP